MQALQAKASSALSSEAKPPFFIYASTSPCPGVTPSDRHEDAGCGADAACAGNSPAKGQGPPVAVWESSVDRAGRPVDAGGRPIPALEWSRLGVTCYPELVPGDKAALTMAQIRAAFHDTDFARPAVHVQPEGDVTLVTLPTYFEIHWAPTGFAPHEVDAVDPARMSGFRVDIRPVLRSVTFLFGDGTTLGPTGSLGGPYPSGDITHAYASSGDYPVRADVTYAGQYRVNGSGWLDIPDTVTIRGIPHTLHVKTAKARLYTH